jgi:hypothetical protein
VGKVVRSERLDMSPVESSAFQVAATLERYEFIRH